MIKVLLTFIYLSQIYASNVVGDIISSALLNSIGKVDLPTKRVSGAIFITRGGMNYPLRMKEVVLSNGVQTFTTSTNLYGEYFFHEKLKFGKYEIKSISDECISNRKIEIDKKSKYDGINITCVLAD